MPKGFKERKEEAHQYYIDARDDVQYTFDRANDTGNHNNNIQNLKAEILKYKNDADAAATAAETAATQATSIAQDARSKATARQIHSDASKNDIGETQKEKDGFDLIRDTALNNATAAELAATEAGSAATNARQKVPYIQGLYDNDPIKDFSYVKDIGIQKYQDIHQYLECQQPCNNGRGGHTFMESNGDNVGAHERYFTSLKSAEEVNDAMIGVRNYLNNVAWPRKENARILWEEADAQMKIAQAKKNSAQSFLESINASADDVTNFANSHDYGWLTHQIEIVKQDISGVRLKKRDEHEPPYNTNHGKKLGYDASMAEYIRNLETQAAIKPFDAASTKLIALRAELKVCTDETARIESEIGKKEGIYNEFVEKIRVATPNVATGETKRDNRKADMDAAKKSYDDLSEELLQLQDDIIQLRKSLTDEEFRYGQLLDDIKKLELDIIYWNQKNYSNKVYNSQNLLNLSENIDHNLQYIFSDLKTQNVNPDLLHTKIQYRKIEEQKLTNINKLLDILFYSFYLSFILIMIVTRNANAEHFVFYIFIGLIPFLYPFVFKNANYLIHSFELDSQKNAFIESDELDNENMFHAYNI